MNIHEYQAKEILKRSGIPVPSGILIDDPEKAAGSVERPGLPAVIKAQVHAGGRGKAGAIKVVSSLDEFKVELTRILGMSVKGIKVRKVLVEEAIDIKKQYYLGITVDRSSQRNVIIASTEGGIEIEETAHAAPEKIKRLLLNPSGALDDGQADRFISSLGLDRQLSEPFRQILKSILQIYLKIDASLLEINPLVVTGEGKLMACDAKINIDDNALFRQPELQALKEGTEDNQLEVEAHKRGLAYVKLPGNIGIIGNGAGLVMATMDEVKRAGGAPANFLDIGGGAKKEVMRNALEMVYMDTDVDGIFINVFGGITRCDEVAKGLIEVSKNAPRTLPVVLRLTGTMAEEGCKILTGSEVVPAETMEEGARKILELVKGK